MLLSESPSLQLQPAMTNQASPRRVVLLFVPTFSFQATTQNMRRKKTESQLKQTITRSERKKKERKAIKRENIKARREKRQTSLFELYSPRNGPRTQPAWITAPTCAGSSRSQSPR